MSDHIPDPSRVDPKRGYDKYGNANFEPASDTGQGPYYLLGLLAVIGLVGGLLYFNGGPKDGSGSTAQAPSTTMSAPAPAPALERAPMATPAQPPQPETAPATEK